MATIPAWQSLGALCLLLVLTHALAARLWRQRHTRPPVDAASRRRLAGWMSGLCAALFLGLTATILSVPRINAVDQQIHSWVTQLHSDAFVQLCLGLTSTGDSVTVIMVTLVAAGLLLAWAQWRTTVGLLISIVGSQATTYGAKYLIARPRPAMADFISASTPSFPSGHATAAVAAYGFILHVICRQLPPGRLRFEVAFGGAVFIALMAASRILLGVHFASDVAAGLAVGAFWLLMGYSACHKCIR